MFANIVYETNGLITKNKFKIMNIAILILCILIMAGIITLGNNQVKITNNQSKIAQYEYRNGNKQKQTKTKRVSSDGVFFRCDNCGFEPHMASSTDDLLIMHFCPKCGSEFE